MSDWNKSAAKRRDARRAKDPEEDSKHRRSKKREDKPWKLVRVFREEPQLAIIFGWEDWDVPFVHGRYRKRQDAERALKKFSDPNRRSWPWNCKWWIEGPGVCDLEDRPEVEEIDR